MKVSVVAVGFLLALTPICAHAQVLPPTISKSFQPTTIPLNGSSTLTLTFGNPNTSATLTMLSVSDDLSAGLTATGYATPVSSGCVIGTLASIAINNTTVSASTPSLAAGASCSVSFIVTAGSAGTYLNTTSNVTSTQGVGSTASATLLVSPEDAFQVNYAANLQSGDAVVNVTNAGTSAGLNVPVPFGNNLGDICANIYVFDPDQEMAACCSCLVSPNSLHSWPVGFGAGSLLSLVGGGTAHHSVAIKLLATNPIPAPNGTACDPALGFRDAAAHAVLPANGYNLVPGMTAWATHSHPTNTATVAITETAFASKDLSLGELGKITQECGAIITQQSSGFCPGCGLGGLAAPAAKNTAPASSLRPSLE